MAELQICLLGSFQVSWDFKPVPASVWGPNRAARLLKLLLLRRPEPVPQAEALRLQGVGDLTPLVATVNRVLAPAASIRVAPDGSLTFAGSESCWIDLDALLEQYRAGVSAARRGEMLAAVLALQEADGLYTGDLLEELQEEWVAEPRRRLQALYAEILDRLAEGHAVLARYQDAVGFCHKALAHDPLREICYQRLMVYYYYLGDLESTRAAYQFCRQVLEENGKRISPESTSLWERLSYQPIEPPSLLAAPAADSPAESDPERSAS